jgi:hypothetical protein
MATFQPGQVTPGGTAEVDPVTGRLTHPDNKFAYKTNDTPITGTGVEGPSAIPGTTIGAGVVREVVDTRNAGYVGTPDGGPDPEAPREWT